MNYGPIIWVEGGIGAGKSTLAKIIAERLGLRLIAEPVESNPYLERFYKDPKRWAFPMQVELLHRRYALQKLAAFEATTEGGFRGAVLDRGLPGDRVFCKLHMMEGNMSELEWQTYDHAYNVMACSLVPPSLMIYLDVEPRVALERITRRARNAEVGIALDYLEKLQRGYLDQLIEIQSGQHAWSRGMEVMRLAWNVDHQPPEALLQGLAHKFDITLRGRTLKDKLMERQAQRPSLPDQHEAAMEEALDGSPGGDTEEGAPSPFVQARPAE